MLLDGSNSTGWCQQKWSTFSYIVFFSLFVWVLVVWVGGQGFDSCCGEGSFRGIEWFQGVGEGGKELAFLFVCSCIVHLIVTSIYADLPSKLQVWCFVFGSQKSVHPYAVPIRLYAHSSAYKRMQVTREIENSPQSWELTFKTGEVVFLCLWVEEIWNSLMIARQSWPIARITLFTFVEIRTNSQTYDQDLHE